MKKKKGPTAFVSGAIAGWCESFCTMPFDTLKTQMQITEKKISLVACGKNIYQHKGFRGFYYGLPAVMTQVSMKAGIRFTAFETYKPIIRSAGVNTDRIVNWIAGTGAGITEALVWVTPTERLKVIRNNEITSSNSRYTTLAQTAKVIVKEQGPMGLYVGAMPTAARAGICVGLRFMIYHDIVKLVTNGHPDDITTLQSLASGFLTGCTSTCVSMPLDVAKSRIQKQGLEKKYNGVLDTLLKTARNEGFTALYKGIPARMLKIGCGQAITFCIYGKVSKIVSSAMGKN